MSFVYDAPDAAATARLGAALAASSPAQMTISLVGTLGAGKTQLVRAVVEALGIEADVQSPTYTLIHEYHGPRTVFHFDVYRIADLDEFEALGPDEYFEAQAICLIEWGDRVTTALPHERMEISIDVTGPQSRRFVMIGVGPEAERVVARCAAALTQSPPQAG